MRKHLLAWLLGAWPVLMLAPDLPHPLWIEDTRAGRGVSRLSLVWFAPVAVWLYVRVYLARQVRSALPGWDRSGRLLGVILAGALWAGWVLQDDVRATRHFETSGESRPLPLQSGRGWVCSTPVQLQSWPAAAENPPQPGALHSTRPDTSSHAPLQAHARKTDDQHRQRSPGSPMLRFDWCAEDAPVEAAASGQSTLAVPRRFSVRCADCPTGLRAGTRLQADIAITWRPPLRNGDERFAAHLQWHRGAWQGSMRAWQELGPQAGISAGLLRWRENLRASYAALYAEPRAAATMSALVLADTQGLDTESWSLVRQAGLLHLLVVSGLHVSFMALLAVWLSRQVLMRLAPSMADRGALLSALTGTLCYAMLTGATVPVLRATLMAGVVLLGRLVWRRLPWIDAWLIALVSVLLWDPLAWVSPGFWLSFLATGTLLAGAGSRIGGSGPGWSEMMRVQLRLTLVLIPVGAAAFGKVVLAGLVLNLLAVPVVTLLLLPAGLCLLALSQGSVALASAATRLVEPLIDAFWWWAGFAPWFPELDVAAPALWMLISVSLLAWLALLLRHPVLWCWLAVVTLAVLWPDGAGQTKDKFSESENDAIQLVLFDVGQGLAFAALQGEHVFLYDTGPGRYPQWDSGSAVIAPWFKRAGQRDIDLLVLSHGDQDHAGGLDGLLQHLPMRSGLAGQPERTAAHPFRQCLAGQRGRVGEMGWEVLWPLSAELERWKGNDLSCVVTLQAGALRILLTGDLERAALKRLTEIYGHSLAADILVLPHHGAASSFLPDLISLTRPAEVWIPVGAGNAFGHPSARVLRWLRQRNIPIRNTAREGAVFRSASSLSKLEIH